MRAVSPLIKRTESVMGRWDILCWRYIPSENPRPLDLKPFHFGYDGFRIQSVIIDVHMRVYPLQWAILHLTLTFSLGFSQAFPAPETPV